MTDQILRPKTSPANDVQSYAIDPAHSSAEFSVKHLMIATVKGRIAIANGHVAWNERDPGASSIVAELPLATIHTGDEKRDAHLRSADFFDVERHPTMRFESTDVQGAGDDYRVRGNLTIRGVTRPVTLEVEKDGVATDPWGNTKVALTARTTIDRTEWGLTWNAALETGGVLVGDKVKVELNVQLVEKK